MGNPIYVGFYGLLLVLSSLALANGVAAPRKLLEDHALRVAPAHSTNETLHTAVEQSKPTGSSSQVLEVHKSRLKKLEVRGVTKGHKLYPKRVKGKFLVKDLDSLHERTLVDYVDYPSARTHPPTEPHRK